MRITKRTTGWLYSLAAVAWCGAIWGTLQLQHLPSDSAHSICGVWGCGPPLPALLACHGFWVALLAFPTAVLCIHVPAQRLRKLGLFLVLAGIAGLLGVAAWEGVQWWPRASVLQRQYVIQRYLFSVSTLVDLPLVQVVLAGLACLVRANAGLMLNVNSQREAMGQ